MAVPSTISFDGLVRAFADAGHSRLPVYGESLDDVIGMLHIKDVFVANVDESRDRSMAALMREPLFVPESMGVIELLARMRQQRTHLAIVVDEFGGTEGLVTIEDVVEEIVGDIASPLDRPLVQPTGDGSWLFAGRIGLREAGDILGVRFPAKGPTTLSGYLALRLGRVPEKGDEVVFPSVKLRVEVVVRRRATEIAATRTPGARPA